MIMGRIRLVVYVERTEGYRNEDRILITLSSKRHHLGILKVCKRIILELILKK